MFYKVWKIGVSYDTSYFVELEEKFLVGDILEIDGDLFLILDKKKEAKELKFSSIKYLGNLFQERTIRFQEFVAKWWYSYFFKIFNLYISNPSYILKYELPQLRRANKFSLTGEYIFAYENFENYFDYIKFGQKDIKILSYNEVIKNLDLSKHNLLVFPDIWSCYNFSKKLTGKFEIYDTHFTALKKYKIFLNIKLGKIKTLLTTHSGVFQDWKKLDNIFVFYPYKWYYKNQQNPRYYLPEIAKQIKFFYNVKNLFYVLD